ncbi:hypothetical protein MQC88_10445, partial [Luteimonas sp. 50]
MNRSSANLAQPRNQTTALAEAACLGRKTDGKLPNAAEAKEHQTTRATSAPDTLAEAQKMPGEARNDTPPQTSLPNAFQR